MADSLHDLLARAAGPPVPLDLEAVRGRGASLRRNRRIGVAVTGAASVVVAVALAVSLGNPVATTLVPDVPASPQPTADSSPAASPVPVEADGVIYGDITVVRGLRVTYDKVDYLKEACESRTKVEDFVRGDRADAICFRNVNPRLRTLTLSPAAPITWEPETDGPSRITAAQLPEYVENGLIWRMRVLRGVVVQLDLMRVASA